MLEIYLFVPSMSCIVVFARSVPPLGYWSTANVSRMGFIVSKVMQTLHFSRTAYIEQFERSYMKLVNTTQNIEKSTRGNITEIENHEIELCTGVHLRLHL